MKLIKANRVFDSQGFNIGDIVAKVWDFARIYERSSGHEILKAGDYEIYLDFRRGSLSFSIRDSKNKEVAFGVGTDSRRFLDDLEKELKKLK